MRTYRVVVALALWLAACGGSARSGDRGPSSNAAGVDGTGGDTASDVGGQPNAAGAPSLGAVDGGGDRNGANGGEPSSAGGESGGAGAGAGAGAGGQAPVCAGLDCLAGAHLIYQPTRTWHAPAGSITTSSELSEADYTAMQGEPIAVTFSEDAKSVQLQPTAGGDMVLGQRNSTHADRAWYELQSFTGGRFVVQLAAGQFVAEYTLYGSGRPIISSTRGTLTQSP